MEIKQKKTSQQPTSHWILLVTKDTDFSLFFSNQNEIDYIKKQIQDKKERISINQYNRWIFVQCIDTEKNAPKDLEAVRKSGAKIYSSVSNWNLSEITITHSEEITEDYFLAFFEGFYLSTYRFDKYKKPEDDKIFLKTISVYSQTITKDTLTNCINTAKGVFHTRNLVNEPLSYLSISQMSKDVERLGCEAGFSVTVFDKKKIKKLNMNGLLAVNKGSNEPPVFIILEYSPKNARNEKPIVLAGKGILFDTGGYSLKPTPRSMDYMKCDMAGAAAVAGTFYAVAKNKIPVKMYGLLPITDNSLNEKAYVPGDIIKFNNGTTVEVQNTDAEGRLVLADALLYAKKLNPKMVIDLATLTGDAIAISGKEAAICLRTLEAKYFDKLMKAADDTYERLIELPCWDEFNDYFKSDVADIANKAKKAGTIVAGKFLQHFTDYPWVHIDIAGTAYAHNKDSYRGLHGTGYGVRLLTTFLESL